MRRLPKLALPVVCLLVFGPLELAVGSRPAVTTYTVTIENMQFSPAELTVRRGDRIVWVNKDLFQHTATAKDKTFDSRSIEANGSWTFNADKVGDYPYTCTFHPTMNGEIHVR